MFRPVAPGHGLLALERLPEDLVGDRRVAFGMAGNSDAPNPGVAGPHRFRAARACWRTRVGNRQVTGHQQHLLHTARGQDAQPLAQSLRIDDPSRDDMR